MGFRHPTLTPSSKQWDHIASQATEARGIAKAKASSGRREIEKLRPEPTDGSKWPGSNNNAPTLHMKEAWRACSPGIPSGSATPPSQGA